MSFTDERVLFEDMLAKAIDRSLPPEKVSKLDAAKTFGARQIQATFRRAALTAAGGFAHSARNASSRCSCIISCDDIGPSGLYQLHTPDSMPSITRLTTRGCGAVNTPDLTPSSMMS